MPTWKSAVDAAAAAYDKFTSPTGEAVKDVTERVKPLVEEGYKQQTSEQSQTDPKMGERLTGALAATGEAMQLGGAIQGPSIGPAAQNLGKIVDGFSPDAQARRHGIPDGWEGLTAQLSPPRAAAPNAVRESFRDAERARWDPLVLDLDGDGVRLIQIENSTAYFDLNRDGYRELVGWVGPNDGLLVDDKNGDNIVNDGGELFGAETVTGFAVLAGLDANSDGVVNLLDPEFQNLKVWADANGDGVSQANEIRSIEDLAIVSIGLSTSTVPDVDGRVTRIFEKATFHKMDGSTMEVVDVLFEQNLSETIYSGSVDVSSEAMGLPNVRGYGQMPNFQIAASINSELLQKYDQLNNSGGYEDFKRNLEDLLLVWAGSAEVDPVSRGGFFDARKLQALEVYMGRGFVNNQSGSETHIGTTEDLGLAWQALVEQYAARFLVLGGPLQSIFPGATYDVMSGELMLNSGAINVGRYLETVRGGGDLIFKDVLEAVQITLLQSRDMWDQSIVFLDEDAADFHQEGSAGETFVAGSDIDNSITLVVEKYYVDLGGGNNNFNAGDGDYMIIAGDGDDLIYVESGDGVVEVGNGRNTVYTGAGDHVIVGGTGADYVNLGSGRHSLALGEGDNGIEVQDGSVQVTSGSGGDYFYMLGAGDGSIILGDGSNSVMVGQGDFYIQTGSGTDDVSAGDGNSKISTGGGEDFVVVGDGGSIIDTGAGADLLQLSSGSHLVFAGDGDDGVRVESGAHLIDLGDGWDYIDIYGGDHVVVAGEGNDAVNILMGRASVDLGGGDDVLTANGGVYVVLGGGGNDLMYMGDGDFVVNGGGGSDEIMAGVGDTVYIFSRGSEFDSVSDDGGVDKVVLSEGISPTDVRMWRDVSNLYIGLVDTNDVLTVQGWFDNAANRVESVVFNDGTIWTTALLATAPFDGTAGGDYLYGTVGNDTLNGFAGDDYLGGDAGADWLLGGDGFDTLVGGDGDDHYSVNLTPNANGVDQPDLVIEDDGPSGGNDTVTVTGASYTLPDNLENLVMTGKVGFGTMSGKSGKHGVGNDAANQIFGFTDNDRLEGLGGNDTLFGDTGNDVLDGGLGIDSLVGGAGDDTYMLNPEYDDQDAYIGFDAINESTGAEGGTDTVDSYVDAYTLAPGLENLVLHALTGFGNELGNTITGDQQNNRMVGHGGNDTLSGGLGNDTLEGGAGHDTLDGGQGNDSLLGGAGDDAYRWGGGAGNDRINDTSGNDQVELSADVSASQIWLTQTGKDLVVKLLGAQDTLTIESWFASTDARVESFKLANGQTLDHSKVAALVDAMSKFSPAANADALQADPAYAPINALIASSWAG